MKRYIIAALVLLSGAAFGQGRNVAFDSLRVKLLLNLNGAKIVKTGYLVVEIDSTVHGGVIRATKFYGDGSNLTGITGSLLAAPDDLSLIADNNSDQAGDIEFVLGDTVFAALERSGIYGDVVLVIGRRNSAVTDGVGLGGFDPGIQHHSSASSSISLSSFTSPGNARQAYLMYNSFLQRVQMGSAAAGNPTGPNIVPVVIAAGGFTYLLIDTTDNVVVQGADHNSFVPAAYTENIHQVMADTSVRNGLARIYGGGSGARHFTMEIDDLNDIMKIVSTKTGTVPGDSAFPIVFWVGGAGGNKMEIYPSGVIRMNGATVGANDAGLIAQSYSTSNPVTGFIFRALNQAGTERFAVSNSGVAYFGSFLIQPSFGLQDNGWGNYIQLSGTSGAINIVSANNANITLDANGTGRVVANDLLRTPNPIELPGCGWFGAQRDTIAGMIPCVSFDDDTAYYDMGIFPHAVSVDSIWLDILTTDTSGDSARFVLGSHQIDFGESYAGAFTTQNSSYADMGAGNLRTKLRFTTEIALDANHRLVLKLYRDNSISNNSAAPLKLAGATLFGKGLR